jgi:hypothetical protein
MESFAPGAFADAGVHTLTAAHPRDGAELPVGHSVEVRDQADGLHGAWHVSDTDTGDEVLTSSATACPSNCPSDSCPAGKSHPRTARWAMRTRG